MARQSKNRTSKRAVKQSKKKARTASRKTATKRAPKQKKVTGIVLKILNGKTTNERLSAEEAFSDPQQAVEQVLYAERHGSKDELRLIRLAFRQYQGRRFRLK
jgi:hypothetical protein